MKPIPSLILPVALALSPWAASAGESVIPLSGTWRFALDEEKKGLDENWHARTLEDSVTLPGMTDTNRKGRKTDYRPADRLARKWLWIGPA